MGVARLTPAAFFVPGSLRDDNRPNQWLFRERAKEVSIINHSTVYLDPLTNCLVMSHLQLASIVGYTIFNPL